MIEKDELVISNHKLLLPIYIIPLVMCVVPIFFQDYFLTLYDSFDDLFDSFKNVKALILYAEIYHLHQFAKVELYTSLISLAITSLVSFYLVGKTYLCSLSMIKCTNSRYKNKIIQVNGVSYLEPKVLLFTVVLLVLLTENIFGYFFEFDSTQYNIYIHGIMSTRIGIFLYSGFFPSVFSLFFTITVIELIAQIRRFFLIKVVSSFIIYTGILFLTIFFGGRGIFLFWEISIPDIYGNSIPITNTNILVNLIVGIILLVFLFYIKKKLKFSK